MFPHWLPICSLSSTRPIISLTFYFQQVSVLSNTKQYPQNKTLVTTFPGLQSDSVNNILEEARLKQQYQETGLRY